MDEVARGTESVSVVKHDDAPQSVTPFSVSGLGENKKRQKRKAAKAARKRNRGV